MHVSHTSRAPPWASLKAEVSVAVSPGDALEALVSA